MYIKEGADKKDSWIRYMRNKLKKNKNNIISIVGSTGSGKTYSGISIGEKMVKGTKVEFGIENIVFSLKGLMRLINGGKLTAGSVILFDEPQCSISSRDFQTVANKAFNQLISTFRAKNFTLIFCTPFEDLLDKSTRKLFHAVLTTKGIDYVNKTVKLKCKTSDYNSHYGKFYQKFLQVGYKPRGRNKYVYKKLKMWNVSYPASQELVDLYEEKKSNFMDELNRNIEDKLDAYDKKEKMKITGKKKELTPTQEKILGCWKVGILNQYAIAEEIKVSQTYISKLEGIMRRKGYDKDIYKRKA